MALPTNKIKKIKLPNSTEAYEIIPERLQNSGFEASLPTLSTNSIIALKSDIDNSVKKSGDSMSGNLNPATNKGASLGTSSLFWNNIYGTTLYENGTSLVDKYANKSHTHTKSQITDFSHTHSKSEVGLGNVDNTADADKPVSNATQQALNNKANSSDVYTKTETDGLLNNKVNKSDVYTKTETDGLLNDKANVSETDNKINKPLYNLGAYDTISGNVITRQTGYATIEDSNILSTFTSGGSKVFAAETNIILPNAVTDWNQEFGISNIGYKVRSVDGNWIFNKSIAGIGGQTVKIANNDFTTIDQFKALCPINIQYKMTTSYTEEIIEGQPLITLDQQGSQWLRDEWEKGLNVFDIDTATIGNGYDYTATASDWVKAINIPVEPNTTYTASSIISRYAFNHGNIVADYNKNTITTGSDTKTLSIFIYVGSYSGTARAWFSNYMLNKGSIAYPYQAYNGEIVHDKDIADLYKQEYNLGYYDTMVENSDGTYTITRQTGYVDLGSLEWSKVTVLETNICFFTTISGQHYGMKMVCSKGYIYKTTINDFIASDKAMIVEDMLGYGLYIADSVYDNVTANEFKNAMQGVMLQYELATATTEKVEKNHYARYNQTFILEHNKSEAERSVNLFNNPYNYSGTNNGVSINIVGNECILNGTSTNGFYQTLGYFNLKAGTYTYNQVVLSGSISGNISQVKFGLYKSDGSSFPLGELTGTYTLTQDTTLDIVIWFGSAGFTFNNFKLSYMLNEGSEPLPYQPYEGKVVHEKDLGSYVDTTTRQEINGLKRFNDGVALKRDDTGIFQTDDGFNLAIKCFGRALHFYGKSGVENYVANAILSFPYSGENNSYEYNFPQKTGTIALTSDIPTFKTINGNSIVGSGDLAITSGIYKKVATNQSSYSLVYGKTYKIKMNSDSYAYCSAISNANFYGTFEISNFTIEYTPGASGPSGTQMTLPEYQYILCSSGARYAAQSSNTIRGFSTKYSKVSITLTANRGTFDVYELN